MAVCVNQFVNLKIFAINGLVALMRIECPLVLEPDVTYLANQIVERSVLTGSDMSLVMRDVPQVINSHQTWRLTSMAPSSQQCQINLQNTFNVIMLLSTGKFSITYSGTFLKYFISRISGNIKGNHCTLSIVLDVSLNFLEIIFSHIFA